ncbi:Glycosyltransferase [Quillaja saponaria]|uniref:Glycosyltransferase n=1 Tax=Quillaja saponaria TaxID=32244 RepID=A0AAD7LQT1_QUISA|nr:Glycosyltransferase [Quillaja saponaria]
MTSIISLLLYYLVFGVKLKFPTYAPQILDIVMDVFGSLSMASLVSLLLPKSWWFIRYGSYVILLVGDLHQMLKILNDRQVHGIVRMQPQPPPLLPETFTAVTFNTEISSVAQQKHQDKVLVIAEDYTTLYKVNEHWPGHAVLFQPALDAESTQNFGSEDFINIASRRRLLLLQILDLGYNVMYNDVDMVWLADPFPYLQGNHDVYFTDDMAAVKPLNHSHNLPPPGKEGRTNICSCMIFLRPTNGAKLEISKWIEELQIQPRSKAMKSNDQPAFNLALNKTAGEVDLYLLPQAAFPTGKLYFKNKSWVQETKGMHVIIHNYYITGFRKKIKLFRKFGLWLVDNHSIQSPLGKL